MSYTQTATSIGSAVWSPLSREWLRLRLQEELVAEQAGMGGCWSAATAKSKETFPLVVALIHKEQNTFSA